MSSYWKWFRMRVSRALGAALLTAILLSGPAGAGELLFEDPLRSLSAVPDSLTRLELGSEAYAGSEGMAMRQTLRVQRRFGFGADWAMTLPWIWTDTGQLGHGGRGNLRMGMGAPVRGLEGLRVTGEFWAPFAAENLQPLSEKRGFLRFGLQYRPAFVPGSLRMGISRSSELGGLVGEAADEPWPSWLESSFLWEGMRWKGLELFGDGRLAWRSSELLWSQAGGGLRLNWDPHWTLSLGLGMVSDGNAGELPPTALSLVLRRDFPDPKMPVMEALEAAGDAPPPPPGPGQP